MSAALMRIVEATSGDGGGTDRCQGWHISSGERRLTPGGPFARAGSARRFLPEGGPLPTSSAAAAAPRPCRAPGSPGPPCPPAPCTPPRSEEHTSELQSHLNLVCRLLLEKKKKKNYKNITKKKTKKKIK